MNNTQWKVSEMEAGLRLDKWLAAPDRLGSRSRAFDAISKGKIFLNDLEQTVAEAARKVETGQVVRLWMDRPGSAQRKFTERHSSGLHLMYEDDLLLVINKPPGLLTVPLPGQPEEDSLFDQVKQHVSARSKREPLVIHRIDRDTSGLVIFAKNFPAQQKLKDQFEQRTAERVYLAVVHGLPQPESGIWKDLLEWNQEELKQQQALRRDRRSKEAVCRYLVIQKFTAASAASSPIASLIEVSLVTGKRNQIRIQAGLRGYPVVGERMYVYENAPAARIKFERQALHAHKLKFKHPADGREMKFEVAPPDDIQRLLERLSQPQTPLRA